MSDAFVGFYWTLPVYWAGFRSLPTDVAAASAKSRTIRYQRERVHEWVRDQAVRLIDEMVFIDVRTDGGTTAVLENLERARTICATRRAKLIYVKFAATNGWRPHKHLKTFCEKHDFAVPIDPTPINIDGRPFDPAIHFDEWRQLDKNEAAKRRRDIARALATLTKQIPLGHGRYPMIADSLNEQGIPTKTGKPWTVDNVRAELRRRAYFKADEGIAK